MTQTRAPFRAACVQMRSGLDRMENARDAAAFIEQAAGDGAKLVATPEMTTVVDRDAKRLGAGLKTDADDEALLFLRDCASYHGVWLLIGSAAVEAKAVDAKADADGRSLIANRSVLIAPSGDVVARYDKIHLFDVDLPTGESWRESHVYAAGERAVVAHTPLGALGLSICYDLRFPALYRSLALAGAEIFTAPAAFTKPTGEAHWETLLRARAIENGAFMVAPAQGGAHEDGRETYGRSMIIDPWGTVLARAEDDEPQVISAEIDLGRVVDARSAIPNLKLEASYRVEAVTS
ncbi:MAG: carbon-nitrogen hydrolase family protein [Pseudomonadota bacterium]